MRVIYLLLSFMLCFYPVTQAQNTTNQFMTQAQSSLEKKDYTKARYLFLHKSRKTKSDGREKRKAIFEAKTKCAQKSRLLPPSGQNTSVVQTPFESCLKDAFLLNFLLKYHLKTHCQFSKKSYLYIVVMLPLCIPSRPHS